MSCGCDSGDNPHYEILKRVVELLRCITFDCFKSDEIYESEFPFVNNPPHGLAVSLLTERLGKGSNAGEDVGYGVQLTRVVRSLGQRGYIASRSSWRRKVLRYFNNKRICPSGVCEIVTKVTPGTIDVPQQFSASGIDPSVMEIWVWVRSYPECGIASGNTIGCDNCS